MRFQLAAVGVVCLLALASTAFAYDSPMRQKIIRKFNSKLSSWIAPEQWSELMVKLEDDIDNGKTPDEIAGAAVSYLMGVMTSAQYTAVMGKGAGMLFSNVGITTLINTLSEVMGNNLKPFMGQLCDYARKAKANGVPLDDIYERSYVMTDQFMTDKRVNTIFVRNKNRWSAAQWKTIYNNFKTMLNFDLYPDALP